MAWTTVILVFCAILVQFCSSQQLSQPPSMSVSPGGTVHLPCTLSSGHKIGSNRVSWYQQILGGAPVFIYQYYTSGDQGRGAEIPDRFSVTPDTAGNLWNLVITGVRVEDDADYYCTSWPGSDWIFGTGTQMNVLSGETQAPSLSIFPPSQEEVEKNKATVVCLAQDFYPASLDVTWMINGQTVTNGVEKSRVTKQIENNLFMGSSYLFMTPEDWSTEKTVTCQVTHQGKTFSKSVKKSECV